jgi:hypothetical protein
MMIERLRIKETPFEARPPVRSVGSVQELQSLNCWKVMNFAFKKVAMQYLFKPCERLSHEISAVFGLVELNRVDIHRLLIIEKNLCPPPSILSFAGRGALI